MVSSSIGQSKTTVPRQSVCDDGFRRSPLTKCSDLMTWIVANVDLCGELDTRKGPAVKSTGRLIGRVQM
eukprot:7058019-Karenia_brevis.AAC.1